MMSKSYTNLLDLAAGNFLEATGGLHRRGKQRLPRTMTMPSSLSELDDDDEEDGASEDPSSSAGGSPERIIIVSNHLPIRVSRRTEGRGWVFSWDEDSLLLQLKDGLTDAAAEVIYVGCLRGADEIDPADHDDVAQTLTDRFRCVPAFLPRYVAEGYYQGFCKQTLWPLFHYMLPFSDSGSTSAGRFDRAKWEAYVLANKIFLEKIVEVINPEDDYVWIHDYHLMALPSFLRRKFNRLRIGFFLHSPFPSSEIYRTLPMREEILKSLLNCDLIGFHTFDYARHFLSCCSRMLGIEYESKRGYIGLDYYGRTVGIKIMPVGIHMGQLETMIGRPDTERRVSEIRQHFAGKTILLGVDDMDVFKGVNLKLLAFEQMLKSHPKWQGRAVLVQIVNQTSARGKDLEAIQKEIQECYKRINCQFGQPDYKPVVFIDRTASTVDRAAYFTIAECVVVSAVRDGMNLTPYEYIVCRQGLPGTSAPKKSMLVVSEFIGCSPSLSGAIRVNPWNVEATGEAINEAISMSDAEKQIRHEKHYRYVSSHDVAYWARSFMQDLEKACKDHFARTCWGTGIGFGFKVIALDSRFRKLNLDAVVSAYKRSKSRAIVVDYDGTLVSPASINKAPTADIMDFIEMLCSDKRNTTFLVSGRRKASLEKWFGSVPSLGIAAEHGYFIRWAGNKEWQTSFSSTDFSWMEMAEPVMKLYTEATDGSSIDVKESAMVWHHRDADPGFGSAQAKELLDHLESVLANEPVSVKSGQFIVEVKPQGVRKGLVVEKILSRLVERGRQADFVLCIGDDRSDEDMFEGLDGMVARGLVAPRTSLFGCTVGQKPSKARYYLDDTTEVVNTLEALADVSDTSCSPGDSNVPGDVQQQMEKLSVAFS